MPTPAATRPGGAILEPLDLARQIVEIIADKKGEDILLLDIQELSILTDYFVIASVNSERQAKAVADEIRQQIKKTSDIRPLYTDNDPATGWILLDYADVIVHLFAPETRAYYDLETLWRDGKIVVRML